MAMMPTPPFFPLPCLQGFHQHFADLIRALAVVGSDVTDVVPAIRADVGDHHRNLRRLGQLQNCDGGRGIGGGEHNAIDLVADGFGRELQFAPGVVIGTVDTHLITKVTCLGFDTALHNVPEGNVQVGNKVGKTLIRRVCTGR